MDIDFDDMLFGGAAAAGPVLLDKAPKKKLDEDTQKQLDHELQQIIQVAASISENTLSYTNKIKTVIEKNEQIGICAKIDCDIPNPTQSPICSKTVGYTPQTNKIFKCLDCSLANNSIQCRQCFSEADHAGHNFIETYTGEGCCDCGNDEMFNPKGFCPAHSKKIEKVNIPSNIRKLFVEQATFLLFTSFWLQDRQEAYSFNPQFIKKQNKKNFQLLLSLSAKNYEMKVLVYEVLKQKIKELFPNLPTINYNKLTIIEMIFRIEKKDFMNEFCRITFELFPIEDIRLDIIKEYFKKVEDDPDLILQHPLRFVNFQFLTCIKSMNKLLVNKQIKPLRLPPVAKIMAGSKPNRLFLRFVEDFQYPAEMKGAKEFHTLICENSNIAEIMFSYREMPDDGEVVKVKFDEYFIKTVKHFIKNISDRKDLLQKVLKQLWNYIVKVKEDSFSLVHENVFAMTLTTYLNGNIFSLKEQSVLDKVKSILAVDPDKFQQLVGHLAKYHLENFVRKFVIVHPKKIVKDYIYEFVETHNPQQQIVLMLDLSYQKILLLLANQKNNYDSIISTIIDKALQGQDNEQQTKQLLFHLISIINCIKNVDIDEIFTQNLTEKINRKNLQSFYGQFINSFKETKAIELKKNVVSVICQKELFEQFVKNQCFIQKGFIRTKVPFEPLPYLSHSYFLKNFNIQLKPSQNKYDREQNKVKLKCWGQPTIKVLIDFCRDLFCQQKDVIKSYQEDSFLPSLFALELITIYKQTQNQYLKLFLTEELPQKLSEINCLFLHSIIKKTFHISEEKSPIKQNQVESSRKNKLLQKKKEKEELIKQKRKEMLEKHNVKMMNMQNLEHLCIFCKEDTGDQLKLTSSVTLEKISNKMVLKQDSSRLCFRTCGHRIHEKCFFLNLYDIEKVCFLCRRPANFLLPDFQKNQDPQFCKQFLQLLYPILLEHYEHYIDQVNQIYNPACPNGMARAIINSIVSEILFFGSHEDAFAKQHVIPILRQLSHLIKGIPQEQLLNAFQLDKEAIASGSEHIELYNKARQLFEKSLTQLQKQQKESEEEEPSIIECQIKDIISIFMGKAELTTTDVLKMIDSKTYLFELPKNLKELQSFMGKCPSCNQVTDAMMLCIICGWKICAKEKPKAVEHIGCHNGALFIMCDRGNLVYFFKEHLFMRESLYLNYVGEPYVANTMALVEASDYNINQDKYDMIVSKIVKNEINVLAISELT